MEYETSVEAEYVTADVSFTPSQRDLELLDIDSAEGYPMFINNREKESIKILGMVKASMGQTQIPYENIYYGIRTDFHYRLKE